MNRNRTHQLVLSHGQSIFGREFPADRMAGRQWISKRAEEGCPLSLRLLDALKEVPSSDSSRVKELKA